MIPVSTWLKYIDLFKHLTKFHQTRNLSYDSCLNITKNIYLLQYLKSSLGQGAPVMIPVSTWLKIYRFIKISYKVPLGKGLQP